MSDDLASVHQAICGAPGVGQYATPTDVDHVRGLVSQLARMKTAAGVTAPLTGTTVAPVYTVPATLLEDLRQQTGQRWLCAGDKRYRTVAECWDQVRLDLTVLPDATPPPAPNSSWKALPVLTSAAATSERSSFQSAVPSWGSDGMTVSLLAKGDRPGTPNPTSGSSTQRCEILIDGWGNLTGTQYLRYDFTLATGFPTSTTDWQTIAQLKNSSTGSPPLELMVGKGGRVYLQWHSSVGAETGTEYLGAAATGAKHSVVLKVPFTTASSAPVSGWFDGAASFTDVSHGPTMYSGQSVYGKLGLYRSNAIGVAATVTHHGVARGTTFASVTS